MQEFYIRFNPRVAQNGRFETIPVLYISEVAPWLQTFWFLGSLKDYKMHSSGHFALPNYN